MLQFKDSMLAPTLRWRFRKHASQRGLQDMMILLGGMSYGLQYVGVHVGSFLWITPNSAIAWRMHPADPES